MRVCSEALKSRLRDRSVAAMVLEQHGYDDVTSDCASRSDNDMAGEDGGSVVNTTPLAIQSSGFNSQLGQGR